jgi:amino acid permease
MNQAEKKSTWKKRSTWETITTALTALGLVMLMQPWSIALYGYSFMVLLLGVIGFTIASKLPV